MRRTLSLAVALVTFLLGTMLGVLHRSMDNINEAPTIEALATSDDIRASLTPQRIGVFIGVDGVTFSANNKKFDRFDDYEDRETVVPLSPGELMEITQQLRAAGLFEEAELNTPRFISLPQGFTIVLAWPDGERQFTWISRDECRVPEKYLRIFEDLNRNFNLPVIRDFIAHNRRVSPGMQPNNPCDESEPAGPSRKPFCGCVPIR